MFNFEKLVIWQKMRSLVKNVYNLSGTFPRHEKFCLTQHIRKTAISVISNLSEGASRSSKRDNKRFVEISTGSLYELLSQLYVAHDLGYLSKEDFSKFYIQIEEICKMMSGWAKYLQQK